GGTGAEAEQLAQWLCVNPAAWGHGVALSNEHSARNGDRLPKQVDAELDDRSRRLDDA
nr:hypothetical protein [Actinomycetota bacterium]